MREFLVNQWVDGGFVGFIMKIIMIYFFAFAVYAVIKRIQFVRKRDTRLLAKYEQTMGLYLNAKEEAKEMLKSHVPFQAIFWIGVFLIILSVSGTSFSDKVKDVLFIIGFVLSLIMIVIYFIKYMSVGGHKGVEETWKEKTMKYKAPEYVTETTYVRWDDEPYGSWRETNSVTYDKNLEHNVQAAAANGLGNVFKVFSYLALSVVYILECLYDVLKSLVFVALRPLVRALAKKRYKKFVKTLAKIDGFIPKDLYAGDEYDEIPNEVANEFLKKSYNSFKSGSNTPFLFMYNGPQMYFTATPRRVGVGNTTEPGVTPIICESKYMRAVVFLGSEENFCNPEKTLVMPVPYRNLSKFYSDQSLYAEDSVFMQVMQKTQYVYLAQFKDRKKKVRVHLMHYENGRFFPITARLCDIDIDDDDLSYKINQYKKSHDIKEPTVDELRGVSVGHIVLVVLLNLLLLKDFIIMLLTYVLGRAGVEIQYDKLEKFTSFGTVNSGNSAIIMIAIIAVMMVIVMTTKKKK